MTKRFYWNGTSDGIGSIMDNETGGYLSYSQCITALNNLHEKNQTLKAENMMLKQQLKEQDDVKWLRENTVWETMPTSRRTFSTTSLTEDNQK